MDGGSRDHEVFSRVWDSLHLDAEEARFDPDRTITVGYLQPDHQDRLKSLPTLALGGGDTRGRADLVLEGVLGEGGVAVVQLAMQGSLGREVAVKRLKPQVQSRELTWKLLQEAWVTGRLEHPNIVPVHLLGRSEDGAAVMVMKRIEGNAWRTFIQGRAIPPGEGFREDPLGWHLDILAAVCRALEFAHSRGIVHRDIKPDNVMVGRFGEVYVVDWGIALSLRDDPGGRLPLARNARGVAGTPAYMAPEMAAGRNDQIDERTDVYLLGATLYEVLTGSPPHGQDTLFDTLFCAFRSDPPRALENVPPELAEICRTAMQPRQEERYQSVTEFRDALLRFKRHRHSATVARQAWERLTRLIQMVDARTERPPDSVKVYDLFGQSRFGFQEALREWEENTDAREGLQQALECMAEFELDRENHQAASVLVGQLPEPNPRLQERLDALERKLAGEQAAFHGLQALARDLDLTAGMAVRRSLFPILFLVWVVVPVGAGVVQRTFHVTLSPRSFLAAILVLIAATLAAVAWHRKVLLQNAVNRSLVVLLLIIFAGFVAVGVLGIAWGLSLPKVVLLALSTLAVGASMVSATINWRVWIMAAGYWAAFLFSIAWPDWTLEAVGGGNLVGFVGVELVLRRWPLERPAQPRSLAESADWNFRQGPRAGPVPGSGPTRSAR